MLVFSQTRNGDYNSKPTVDDVVEELEHSGPYDAPYAQAAANRGHGEYINNVRAVADVCRERCCTDDRFYIARLIRTATIEDA